METLHYLSKIGRQESDTNDNGGSVTTKESRTSNNILLGNTLNITEFSKNNIRRNEEND